MRMIKKKSLSHPSWIWLNLSNFKLREKLKESEVEASKNHHLKMIETRIYFKIKLMTSFSKIRIRLEV